MIYARKYTPQDEILWNNFLPNTKNSTFLFSRNYMDYHKDRFQDFSVLVFEEEELVAMLPANVASNIVHSHQGLTFGGVIVKHQEYAINTIAYFKAILHFLFKEGIEKFVLKQIPVFYNTVGAEEIDYALFITNAKLFRIDTALVKSLTASNVSYQERRTRSIKKAIKANVQVRENNSFTDFWEEILSPTLLERYGVKPVHSLEEINYLQKNNPEKIRQFNAYINDKIVAGCTIYESQTVAHCQYIASNLEGRNTGGIDFLFDWMIKDIFKHKQFFDFGIANENNGRGINRGLFDWKEGFGARPYAHRFYEVETKNFELIAD